MERATWNLFEVHKLSAFNCLWSGANSGMKIVVVDNTATGTRKPGRARPTDGRPGDNGLDSGDRKSNFSTDKGYDVEKPLFQSKFHDNMSIEDLSVRNCVRGRKLCRGRPSTEYANYMYSIGTYRTGPCLLEQR